VSRRNSFIVLGLLAAALVGVALMAIPASPLHKKPTLGLDLQGGLEVTLQAVPPVNRKLTSEDLDRSVDIMRNRVDKLGVSEPSIYKQGSDQIVIQLPGVKDPEAAAEIIGTTAQLELFDLETSLVGPSISIRGEPVENPSLYALLAQVQAQVQDGTSEAYYIVNPKTKRVVSGPYGSEVEATRKSGGKLPAGRRLFAVPKGMVVVSCGEGAVVCPGAGGAGVAPDRTYYYLFKYDPPNVPQMTGEDLKLSGTRADFDTSPGGGNQPIVTIELTGSGADKFEKITRDEWIRGKLRQQPQHFAIVLDREIKTFPQIDFTDNSLSSGIGGGRAQIQGLDSIREAKDIALVLQTGALPVKFETLDRTDISATLGKDSLSEAWKAAIAGIILVAIFLLIFYRFLGLVAVAGLAIYAAFLYATILLFNVTLTLPGFAGLVLTFGVAADANIVIFERIKEEVRAGKSVRAAIAQGYRKGFATIVDANVVTAITALVLFVVATASVRGFALMLLIGTALSMLTAVAATRAILAVLGGFGWFDNPRFMGATGEGIPRWLRIDFMGKRRIWFAISGAVVALSILAIAINGLNLGIDFRGGTQLTFRTANPTSLEQVRSEAAGIGQAGAVIQGRGSSTDGKYTSFQIRTEALTTAEQNELQLSLTNTVEATAFGAKNISESFGRQISLETRALRDRREPSPDRRLHLDPLPVEVLGRRSRRARVRRGHHCRDLRAHRTRGLDGDRGGDPHRARLLDLRHDHRLRPHARERPAHAACLVPRHREHLDVGGAPAVAGDDVHHVAPGRLALLLRRRHAQGLRVRAPRRHRLRRVLVHLPCGSSRRRPQGARARVCAATRRPRGARRRRVGRWNARRGGRGGCCNVRRGGRRRRRGGRRRTGRTTTGAGSSTARAVVIKRAPTPAAHIEATWQSPLARRGPLESARPGGGSVRSPSSRSTRRSCDGIGNRLGVGATRFAQLASPMSWTAGDARLCVWRDRWHIAARAASELGTTSPGTSEPRAPGSGASSSGKLLERE
jgi:SecD/SecF fusion protein